MVRYNRFGLTVLAAASALFVSAVFHSGPVFAQGTAVSSKADLATGVWGFDKPHTNINFTAVHLGLSKVHGSFDDFDGVVNVNGRIPEKSSVVFTIKTASINTGVTARDNHLKSKDFFEVEKYPEITFKSTKIARRKGGFNAIGILTIHGVSKVVVLPFTVLGPQKGMEPGAPKVHMGVDTALTIDRRDFGLTWNALIEGSKAVSDDIKIDISMDLVKQ